jgi:phosphoglycerol transferase MdoB-like AlkP superfamily enzyme
MGVHGLSGHMFNRSTWYKTIGFEEQWFHDQLAHEGLPDCGGAFVGICDARIADWIARRLETRHAYPIFLHWMTLNSHLPLVVPSEVSNGAPCDRTDSLVPDSPLCSWYQLVENVHRSVADLASAPLSRPTIFVVVGDHAPPFSDPAVHDRFSSSDVPYVILVPRQEHRIPTNMIAHNAAQPGFESSLRASQRP